jgi:hypothetical protein
MEQNKSMYINRPKKRKKALQEDKRDKKYTYNTRQNLFRVFEEHLFYIFY